MNVDRLAHADLITRIKQHQEMLDQHRNTSPLVQAIFRNLEESAAAISKYDAHTADIACRTANALLDEWVYRLTTP